MTAPVAPYTSLIERFVGITPSIAAHLIRTEGIVTKARANAQLNELVATLSPSQRERLAAVLEYERRTTIFDSLVQLHEFCASGNWTLFNGSTTIPLEPNGYTLFEEYQSRIE